MKHSSNTLAWQDLGEVARVLELLCVPGPYGHNGRVSHDHTTVGVVWSWGRPSGRELLAPRSSTTQRPPRQGVGPTPPECWSGYIHSNPCQDTASTFENLLCLEGKLTCGDPFSDSGGVYCVAGRFCGSFLLKGEVFAYVGLY